MRRSKKFILIALLAVVVLVGSTAGVIFAQTGNGDGSQPKTLLARVAEILEIDQQRLEDAFAQARGEMKDEALDRYLQNLVEQGRITQEQADQYRSWIQAKPDTSQFQQQITEWQQAMPGVPAELKEWQQSRPDIPPGSFKRHFGFRRFGGGFGTRGWGGPRPTP